MLLNIDRLIVDAKTDYPEVLPELRRSNIDVLMRLLDFVVDKPECADTWKSFYVRLWKINFFQVLKVSNLANSLIFLLLKYAPALRRQMKLKK